MSRRQQAQDLWDQVYHMYGDPAAWVEKIRARRKRYGISQSQLAKRAGADPSHVSKWIGDNRTTQPRLANMMLLDEALIDLVGILHGVDAVERMLRGDFP